MADEHRADVAGFAGNGVVRTPVLDELARTGVVFENAYCPSPICVPCRQSMAAGQLPRTSGVEVYGQDLPPFSMTFARRLSQFGYDTVCCGKLHHDGPDQMQGWTRRIGSNTRVESGYIQGADKQAMAARPRRHMPYQLRDKHQWEVQNAGVGRGSHTQVPDELTLRGAELFIGNRWLDPYYDRVYTDTPTMLMISFNRPHYPYLTREELFTYYLNRVPLHVETETFGQPFLDRFQVKPGRDVTEREIRRATAAYYGMIEEIDTDYGTVLDRLRHAGQDPDDWVIVYTADHGEMLGEHGIWEKQKFFEASARVPLIVRYPRRFAPRRVSQNVNLCDLFATLCDLTGTPLPPDEQTVNGAGLDSRSLVPLMQGDASEWNDETVSQFGGTNLMIKRGALKYQFYDRDDCRQQPEVLFDLARDPGERTNAIDDPAYANEVETFRKRSASLGFGPDAEGYRNAGYGS